MLIVYFFFSDPKLRDWLFFGKFDLNPCFDFRKLLAQLSFEF